MNLGVLWEWETKKLNATITNEPANYPSDDSLSGGGRTGDKKGPSSAKGRGNGNASKGKEGLGGPKESSEPELRTLPSEIEDEEQTNVFSNGFTIDYEDQMAKRAHMASNNISKRYFSSSTNDRPPRKTQVEKKLEKLKSPERGGRFQAAAQSGARGRRNSMRHLPSVSPHHHTHHSLHHRQDTQDGSGDSKSGANGGANGNSNVGDDGKVFKSYLGDIFGTRGNYVNGMVYRSRMKAKLELQQRGVMMMGREGMGGMNGAHSQSSSSLNGGNGGATSSGPPGNLDSEGNGIGGGGGSTERGVPGGNLGNGGGSSGDLGSGGGPLTSSGKSGASASSAADDEKRDQSEDKYEAKQRCAATLRNWSFQHENAVRMVNEGAVQALVELASIDDKKTRSYCATAFRNLSADVELRENLVSEGAVETIVELAASSSNEEIHRECATALCNLSMIYGAEPQLVEAGAVLALMVLMGDNESLAPVCARALFNFTCVDKPYLRIERVIKGFVALASTGNTETKQIAAQALCNLSTIKRIRLRMVEEGVVQVLGTLARSSDKLTKRVCASVMYNLSAAKHCRAEMVAKGAVAAIITLSNYSASLIAPSPTTGSPSSQPSQLQLHQEMLETQYFCTSALNNLAKDPASRGRIVSEGAIIVLTGISRIQIELIKNGNRKITSSTIALSRGGREAGKPNGERPSTASSTGSNSGQATSNSTAPDGLAGLPALSPEAAIRVCAEAIMTLSFHEESKARIIEKGGVAALISLSDVDDLQTRQYCTLALCNLLTVESSTADIVQQGAVSALVNLAQEQNEETRRSCALALYNLSCNVNNRALVVSEGTVPAIISLSSSKQEETRTRCAASLCNLSCHEANRQQMVDEGVVPCLVMLLTEEPRNVAIERNCTTALCMLSFDPSRVDTIVEQGAVPPIIQISSSTTDLETKIACCAVVASLSYSSNTQLKLKEYGVIPALVTLSQIDDSRTRRRCAAAFCNLSSHPALRADMIDAGVVSIVADLCNTYSEENQQDCAKALCNISCHRDSSTLSVPGSPGSNASQSANSGAAVGGEKKDHRSTSAKGMSRDGKDKEKERLSCEVRIVKEGAVSALMMIAMVRAVSSVTKHICATALLNLMTPASIELMIQEGLVQALSSLAKLESPETMLICSKAFCLLTASSLGRSTIASKHSTLVSLFSLLRAHEKETQIVCGKAVCNLLGHPASQIQTVEAGAIPVLKILATLDSEESEIHCAEALATLSYNEKCVEHLVKQQALDIVVLLIGSPREETTEHCVRAMCNLTQLTFTRVRLVEAGAVRALVSLISAIMNPSSALNVTNGKRGRDIGYVPGGIPEDPYGESSSKNDEGALSGRWENLSQPSSSRKISKSRQELLAKCARTLCSLSLEGENHLRMVEEDIGRAVISLARTTTGPPHSSPLDMEIWSYCSLIIRQLSSTTGTEVRLVSDGVVPVLAEFCSSAEALSVVAAAQIDAIGTYPLVGSQSPKWHEKGSEEGAVIQAASQTAPKAVSSFSTPAPSPPMAIKTPRTSGSSAVDGGGSAESLGGGAGGGGSARGERPGTATSVSSSSPSPLSLTLPVTVSATEGGGTRSTGDNPQHANPQSPQQPQSHKSFSAISQDSANGHGNEELSGWGGTDVSGTSTFQSKHASMVVHSSSNSSTSPMPLLDRPTSSGSAQAQRALSTPNTRTHLLSPSISFHSSEQGGGREGSSTTAAAATSIAMVCEMIWLDCAISFCNFAFCGLQENLIREGVLTALHGIADSMMTETKRHAAACLRCLASQPLNRAVMVEQGCISVIVKLINGDEPVEDCLKDCAASISSLSKSKSSRKRIVDDGAIPALISLSHADDDETKQCCAIAVSNLSTASVTIEKGTVSALIEMSLKASDQGREADIVDKDPVKPSPLPPRELPPLSDGNEPPEHHILSTEVTKISAGLATSTTPPPMPPPLDTITVTAEGTTTGPSAASVGAAASGGANTGSNHIPQHQQQQQSEGQDDKGSDAGVRFPKLPLPEGFQQLLSSEPVMALQPNVATPRSPGEETKDQPSTVGSTVITSGNNANDQAGSQNTGPGTTGPQTEGQDSRKVTINETPDGGPSSSNSGDVPAQKHRKLKNGSSNRSASTFVPGSGLSGGKRMIASLSYGAGTEGDNIRQGLQRLSFKGGDPSIGIRPPMIFKSPSASVIMGSPEGTRAAEPVNPGNSNGITSAAQSKSVSKAQMLLREEVQYLGLWH